MDCSHVGAVAMSGRGSSAGQTQTNTGSLSPRGCGLTSRRQLDLAGRFVDRLDADFDRIPEPESPAAATADQRRGEVVELEVVAGETAGREEALKDLAEASEEARADDADDLAFERLVPASFVELGVEQPGQADVVRAVFHICCSPLPLGRVVCELAQIRWHRVLGNVQLAEQGAMDDQVGVAPNRRGEMAVRGAGKPRMAEILRVVASLL